MKPVLLLVDLQQDYLATRGLQPAAEDLLAQTAELIEGCRKRRIPVIHVWTTVHRDNDQRMLHWRRANIWRCVAGTIGHQAPARLQPQDGETVIHKTGFNAFANPELDSTLRRLNCDTVIIAGVHLHTCVRLAAMGCLERNLPATMAADAVASDDPAFSASTRRWLVERCVKFEPVSAILMRLDRDAEKPLPL
ncbi:MAG TPA: cysteine hydrolase [Candidatus Nitrosopolaris sp.]|nr:cysteine hydrolase [Candidatus Nitrosopolaris sp.]